MEISCLCPRSFGSCCTLFGGDVSYFPFALVVVLLATFRRRAIFSYMSLNCTYRPFSFRLF